MTEYHVWARSAAGWRPCTHYHGPDAANDIHEARYLAARWLAIDGVREVVVLPAGVIPDARPLAEYIPGAVWRARVTLDRGS